MYGHLSGLNTQFTSGDASVTYFFYGSQSGYNTTITCGNGHSCQIYCYGNGCNGLSASCDGSCSLTYHCSQAEQSDVCSDGMCCHLFDFFCCCHPNTNMS